MYIAHFTDLHLRPRGVAANRVVETNMLVTRAFDVLVSLQPKPDVLVITGDLTECGRPDEYATLTGLIEKLDIPVLVVPGNHDRRENLRAALGHLPIAESAEGFVQFALDVGPCRLVGLDTVVPGKGEGALCATRLAFLEDALAGAEGRPTLVFMHHPPFDCGIGHMDKIRLHQGEAEFGEIIRRYPNVERILCGHHHRPIANRYAGTIATTGPSVAHQVTFEIASDAEGTFHLEPPAFQMHMWTPRSGVVSHMIYVERYSGPFPFLSEPDYPGRS